jgi:hypothetical protein
MFRSILALARIASPSSPRLRALAVAATACGLFTPSIAAAQSAWRTVAPCSVTTHNFAATDHCFSPAISADARHVLFVSRATNFPGLVGGGVMQVYAWDRQIGRVAIVSARVTSGNLLLGGDLDSVAPACSADGRYAAIQTDARTIVPTPFFSGPRIIVIDRDRDADGVFDEPGAGNRAAVLVSIDSAGQRIANTLKPSISGTGRFVAFHASTVPLLAGDGTETPYRTASADVYVHDRDANQNGVFDETSPGARKTVKVSVDSAGQTAAPGSNSINAVLSADGRFVAFESNADNLASDDTNDLSDIFLHDRDADGNGAFDEPGGIATTRVNVASNGRQANGPTSRPALSADGRYIAFDSLATHLAPGVTHGLRQVYLHDRLMGTTKLISTRHGRVGGNGHSYATSISADGAFVAFHSEAFDLVDGDSNGAFDVFVWDRIAAESPGRPPRRPVITRASVSDAGAELVFGGIAPALDGSGRNLAFASVTKGVIPIAAERIYRQVYAAQRQD